jgi:hypothetical protein
MRGTDMTGRRILARIKLTLLIIAIFCLSGISVMAEEEPQFILEIESEEMDIDSETIMTVTMVNAEGATVKDIVGMEWFFVPCRYDNEISNKEVNGRMAFVETLSYDVYPNYSGKFVVWATIDYNGQTYMTNKLNLTVRDNKILGIKDEDAFLQSFLSDNEVYVGQKTILAYDFYSKYEIDFYFFVEDLHIDNILRSKVPTDSFKTENVVHNGSEYTKAVAELSYLTPLKPGLYTIPESVFYAYVSAEEFLVDSSFRLLSEPKELIVKPLPTQNQPSDFSWIIGKLKIDAEYDTSEADKGSITLNVKASGDCSMESLDKIFKEELPNFSVFEYEAGYSESAINNQYYAEREFQITLIPKINGEITIDPIYISYFDTETATYEKAEIPGVTVTVDGVDRSIQTLEVQTHETGGSNNTLETVRIEQISYAPQSDGFWTIRVNKAIAISIMVLLILGAAVLYFLKRPKKIKDPLDDIYAQLLKEKDENAIYNLFNSMIRHCFGLNLKASSRSEISDAMPDKRLVEPILSVVEYVENEKPTPSSDNKKLIAMIKDIYKMLKERKS